MLKLWNKAVTQLHTSALFSQFQHSQFPHIARPKQTCNALKKTSDMPICSVAVNYNKEAVRNLKLKYYAFYFESLC